MFSFKDLYEIFMLSASLVPAWLLPQRAWRPIAMVVARVQLYMRPTVFEAWRQRINTALETMEQDATTIEPRRLQENLIANNYEAKYLQTLRFWRPGGWNPAVRLVGREHIERALAEGNGAILWVYPFIFYSVITKLALADAGFPPVHLNRPQHGFSGTRFGMRCLNPLLTRVEDRFIAERITLVTARDPGPLRTLVDRIRSNQVITITGNAEGRKVHSVPFFNGRLQLAPGPPSLALSHQAILLPTMTVRDQNGEFVVRVEPALEVSDGGASRSESEINLVQQFANVLKKYVQDYPDQWPDWHNRSRWTD